jgi:hypothetical protein
MFLDQDEACTGKSGNTLSGKGNWQNPRRIVFVVCVSGVGPPCPISLL